MDINSAFESKYLAASDLQGRDWRVTMSHVVVEKVGQGEQAKQKPILYFRGTKKGLVLNRTNANTIGDIHGNETEHWNGREITLGPAWVDYQGQQRLAIRVRPQARAAFNQAPATQQPHTQMPHGNVLGGSTVLPNAASPPPPPPPFNDPIPDMGGGSDQEEFPGSEPPF